MKKPPDVSLGAALAAARAELADVPGGSLDAELLVAHAAATTRTAVYAFPERPLTPAAAAQLQHQLAERRRGVPLAYLVGRRAFHAIEVEVTRDVLVPRPETELLVDLTLGLSLPAGARILDAGCGSGAVALAIKHARADLAVYASDRSLAALRVSQRNARALGLHVPLMCADWCTAIAPATLAALVSNPPYVAEADPALSGDIRHEPRAALTAGPDGLDDLRRLARTDALAPAGYLLLEHGHDQGAAVRTLLTQAGFTDVRTERDLAGHERVTMGRRMPGATDER